MLIYKSKQWTWFLIHEFFVDLDCEVTGHRCVCIVCANFMTQMSKTLNRHHISCISNFPIPKSSVGKLESTTHNNEH